MSAKRLFAVPALLLLLATAVHVRPAAAVPAPPHPVATTQPDGAPILVRIIGDEWYHFYETPDGYAIVQDAEGWWRYAELGPDERYAATPHVVGRDDIAASAFRRRTGLHLREAGRYRTELQDQVEKSIRSNVRGLARSFKQDAAVTLAVPVVLVGFPYGGGPRYDRDLFAYLMNMPGYLGTGSFRDYYLEVSYGKLTVNATVVGWYTAPNLAGYYRYGNGTIAEYNRARELVRSAVDVAESRGLNWAPFDNDADGKVDAVLVVHAGPGAEGGNRDYIWSHAWYLNAGGSDLSVICDGKRVDRYVIMPEVSATGGMIEIGVFCHEFGHVLGLPDLYDVDYSSAGVGAFDLMAAGSWGGDGGSPQRPTHLSAWSKAELGWLAPVAVAVNTIGTPIPQAETNPVAYRLWTNGAAGNEYFLVENREPTGFDAMLPASGLAIWHVDRTRRRSDNMDNADEARKLVDLEEADGFASMDAGPAFIGDSGDFFPGSSNKRTFSGASNPISDDYAGAPTLVSVSSISNPAATMTADLAVTAIAPPDLLIRDCLADVGAEPDLPCQSNWVRSPDIWIDNNDDGIIDPPVQGIVNHLYVRAWNVGGPATNATIRCWYVDPSLGLNFGLGSPGTPIVDAVTTQTTLAFGSLNPLIPTPFGAGYRAYFNWLIPTPPPDIDHYCIGCAIENAADPQASAVPLQENNLAQINYSMLARKAGTQPALAKGAPSRADTGPHTVFRERVRIYNRELTTQDFALSVEELAPGWLSYPTGELITLAGQAAETLSIYLTCEDSHHLDSSHVAIRLYKYPAMELTGELVRDLLIDSVEPAGVGDWTVEWYKPPGDDLPRPSPTVEVSWAEPTVDVLGFPERVRYYEVHAAVDSANLTVPSAQTRVAITRGDADPSRAGYQYRHCATDDSLRWFTVRAVDLAGNLGARAPLVRLMRPPAGVAGGDSWRVAELLPFAPNPFGARTRVAFRLNEPGPARVTVLDLAGRLVAELARGPFASGVHRLEWDGRAAGGRAMPPGVYVVRLEAAGADLAGKVLLLH